MIDRPDPIEAWREVSATAAQSTAYRPGRSAHRWSALASIGAMIGALAIIVAGLALRPAASGIGVTGPVSATVDDGTFRLELTTPHGTYGPGDAIETVARVTYLGPDDAVTVQHSLHPLVFQIQEVDGVRAMDGGDRLSCGSTNLVKDQALEVPFGKSGSPDDASKGFDLAWYTDPVLTLPVGTWRITANMDFGVGGCGTTNHLAASNMIQVIAPGGDGPNTDRADDGVFRLELSTDRRTYAPGDPIEPVATVSFLGPDDQIAIHHGGQIVGWEIAEVGGARAMNGGMTAPCVPDVIRRDAPLSFSFAKSGAIGESFDEAWFRDPVLRLPVGIWRIKAYTTISTDENPAPSDGSFTCGTKGHSQDASIVITVGDGAPNEPTGPPPTLTPTPSPTPETTSSTVPFSNDPVMGSADDGAFRLDLTTPRRVFSTQDAIAPVATLSYLGPGADVTFGHAEPAVIFTIGEIGGSGRQMGGGADDLCALTTLTKDRPATSPFQKGGSPDMGFDMDWFRDPVLRLPTGTWRIEARFEGGVPACDIGASQHALTVENIISVVDSPATSPEPAPSTSALDAARAFGTVKDYEGAIAANRLDQAWAMLSPWSQAAVGSRAAFDTLIATTTVDLDTLVISKPSQDPDLLAVAFLGPRAADLGATAFPARTFVVSVTDTRSDDVAAATTNLVVAPLADGTWRIWLDMPGR